MADKIGFSFFVPILLCDVTVHNKNLSHLSFLQNHNLWFEGSVKNVYFYKFLLYLVQSESVRVVEMLELRTWYEKVTKDNVASAYVLRPLRLLSSQFMRGQIRRLKVDERD